MKEEFLRVFLADDDDDDCMLFEEALHDISRSIELTVSRDGDALMHNLGKEAVPHVLFLDLNMPRKSGLECLKEMKESEKLKHVPIVVFSTSTDPEHIKKAFQDGANYYARKPSSFQELKKLLTTLITIRWERNAQPPFDKFLL